MATSDLINSDLLDQSILFARLAAAAYLDKSVMNEPGLEKLRNELRLNEHNSENKTDTQALLCRWNKDIVISFRGTEQKFADWGTDLNGRLIKNPAGVGLVHSGFHAASNSVYQHVTRYINQVREEGTRLFVCGHSLGGALAFITASRLTLDPNLPPVRGVFTYGAPRPGDAEFADAFFKSKCGNRTTMWSASGDPVVRVVPFASGYRHAVPRQFTLKESAIGLTSLDGEVELLLEHEWLKGMPLAKTALWFINNVSENLRAFNASMHSVSHSYLTQLVAARG